MSKVRPINSWVLLGLSKREMFVGLILFVLSGLFFKELGKKIVSKIISMFVQLQMSIIFMINIKRN